MSQAVRPGRVPIAAGDALLLAAGTGLVTGYLEYAYAAIRRHLLGRLLLQPLENAWMAPLADGVVFLLVVVLLLGLGRAVRRRPSMVHMLGVCLVLSALSLLWLLPQLNPGAAVLLAVGVGTQGARLGRRGCWPGLPRVLRYGTPTLAALTAGTALGGWAWRLARERRAVATLAQPPAGAPNVLLLVLDTVRAWNLSLYGYGRPTTPELERFAARGVRFSRALSPSPWTRPAHASIFTGREAFELSADWSVPLDRTFPTLAERLREAGYLTAGFSANVWYAGRESGFARGFIRFHDYPLTPVQIAVGSALLNTAHRLVSRLRGRKDDMAARQSALEVDRAFLQWLAGVGQRPWFAFLNYYDTHTPYLPPEAYRRRFTSPGAVPKPQVPDRPGPNAPVDSIGVRGALDAYDGAIRFLDEELGRLFATLESRGTLRNTVVIVVGDHGEEFYEHAVAEHGNSLYRAALEVPLVLVYPGRIPAGITVTTPVSTRSIPATALALAKLSDGAPFPGPTLIPFWEAPDTARLRFQTPIFSEVRFAPGLPSWFPVSRGNMLAVLDQGLRYIRNGDGTVEVYDFERDPTEGTNLSGAPERQAAIAGLRRLVDSARSVGR